jgi:membrane protease YdiL (CAAX protease family)
MVENLLFNVKNGRGKTAVVVPWSFAAWIVFAEVVSVLIGPGPGSLLHAFLLPVLLTLYSWGEEAPYRRILPVLALLSLLRLLSLVMPVPSVAPFYWHVLIGSNLLLALLLTVRLLNVSRRSLALQPGQIQAQALIAISGLPLAIVARWLLRPSQPPAEYSRLELLVGSLILLIFAAFVEEILFRGLLRSIAGEVLGAGGTIYGSLLFAAMHAGSLSLSYALFMGLVGLFFNWCVERTNSLLGVIFAHTFILIAVTFGGWFT